VLRVKVLVPKKKQQRIGPPSNFAGAIDFPKKTNLYVSKERFPVKFGDISLKVMKF